MIGRGGVNGEIAVVRNARARRLRLSVDPASGQVRLTLPPRASLKRAMAWVEEQGAWIAEARAALPAARPFVHGATIPLEGAEVAIDWAPDRPRTVRLVDGALVCGGPAEGLSRRIAAWLRRRALDTLSAETADYAARAGVTIASVAVGDPKSRWGSCASSGAIRYSWRLILMPPEVRRATVAHEVAHRIEMNHSPAFHAAAARIFGRDPSPERAWLRRHGAALHWVGR